MPVTPVVYNDEAADQLRLNMAAVRKDLGADIRGVAAQARELTDWRRFVKRAPWTTVALATAAGFAAVPRRLHMKTVDPDTIARLAEQERIVVEHKPKTTANDGLGSTAFRVLSAIVLRSALGFASQKAAELLASGPNDRSGLTRPQAGRAR